MNDQHFESLVTRLEVSARENPQRYLLWVLGVALLFALVPAALLAGLVLVVILTGGKALILLLKLGKLVVLLLIPAWVMIKSSFQMLFTRFPRPQGRSLKEDEAPALFARIH